MQKTGGIFALVGKRGPNSILCSWHLVHCPAERLTDDMTFLTLAAASLAALLALVVCYLAVGARKKASTIPGLEPSDKKLLYAPLFVGSLKSIFC